MFDNTIIQISTHWTFKGPIIIFMQYKSYSNETVLINSTTLYLFPVVVLFSLRSHLLMRILLLLYTYYTRQITSKCLGNTHNPLLLLRKNYTRCTVLLCSICTCVLVLLKGSEVCICVCILATQPATLAGLF